MALGMLGVGYAMWSDTVYLDGTVETGTVDIVVDNTSDTWVYKVIQGGGILFEPAPLGGLTVIGDDDGTYMLIASANTSYCGQDVAMTFQNLFPTTSGNITADVKLHYVGSIPAHIALDDLAYSVISGADLTQYMVEEWDYKPNGEAWQYDVDPETIQLHYCDYLWLKVRFLLPQDNALQGASGTISGSLVATQWNE
jgi:hypothetical protein